MVLIGWVAVAPASFSRLCAVHSSPHSKELASPYWIHRPAVPDPASTIERLRPNEHASTHR